MDATPKTYKVGMLVKTKNPKTGRMETVLDPCFRYSTFKGALRCLYRLMERTKVSEAKNIEEAIAVVDDVHEQFEKTLKGGIRPWTTQ